MCCFFLCVLYLFFYVHCKLNSDNDGDYKISIEYLQSSCVRRPAPFCNNVRSEDRKYIIVKNCVASILIPSPSKFTFVSSIFYLFIRIMPFVASDSVFVVVVIQLEDNQIVQFTESYNINRERNGWWSIAI